MTQWKDFLAALDSQGGHVFLLTAAVVILFLAILAGNHAADKYADVVFGAWLYAMQGQARTVGIKPTEKIVIE